MCLFYLELFIRLCHSFFFICLRLITPLWVLVLRIRTVFLPGNRVQNRLYEVCIWGLKNVCVQLGLLKTCKRLIVTIYYIILLLCFRLMYEHSYLATIAFHLAAVTIHWTTLALRWTAVALHWVAIVHHLAATARHWATLARQWSAPALPSLYIKICCWWLFHFLNISKMFAIKIRQILLHSLCGTHGHW